MSEHTRRSPYEPDENDGSKRNSRQDPADLRAKDDAAREANDGGEAGNDSSDTSTDDVSESE